MRDRDITLLMKIVQYANEVNETISRLELDLDKFKSDFIAKNAISMCVLQIGELANILTAEFKAAFKEVPWRDIISIRNKTAHAYFSIDFEILWGIATIDIPELKAYCERIIKEKESGSAL